MSKLNGARFMRVMIMFDLPVETAPQRKAYRQFRKGLIKDGFIMMQESIYSKIVLNPAAASALIAKVRLSSPHEGLIQAMVVTEKQFADIIMIRGQMQTEFIDNMDKVVIL